MFTKSAKINLRRKQRLEQLSKVVRPDNSRLDLLRYQREGYTQVVFVKNPISDESCAVHNGEIYEIDDLLKLDYPLASLTHTNCTCQLRPYGKKKNVPQPTYIPKQEIPPTTIVQQPPQPKKVQL